ncbi:MAG: hypothetical protein MUD01_23860 [Chloroflexaceae bacterium]|jgi:hypothetical protein|nr:hypothetical protein [Chloroflexaceae bacterium]
MQDPAERPKKGGLSNWIGIIFFLVLAFGSQLITPLARMLTQITGVPINPSTLFGIAVVGAFIVPVLVSFVRSALRISQRNDARLPTQLSQPGDNDWLQSPRTPAWPSTPSIPSPPSMPYQPRLDIDIKKLAQPPRFDPVFNPRIVWASLGGAVLFAAFVAGAALLTGALP